MINIRNLEVSYKKHKALHINKNITINENEKIGIIGANGAGKSTLIKAILNLVSYSGTIQTNIDVSSIAVHMQSNEYTTTMPIKTLMKYILSIDPFKDEKMQELVNYFEFNDCMTKKYDNLSGGEKQKFTLIMVLYQNSKITIYDEVTTGLDFEARMHLTTLLTDYHMKNQGTVLYVSHYYEELEKLVDKIMLLDNGDVIEFDTVESLFEKYCGYSTIIINNTTSNQQLANEYNKIHSPNHLIALKCQSADEEREMIEMLTENDVDFKRSRRDIELISINAIREANHEKNK